MSAGDASTTPNPVAWRALALMLAAIVAGGGAVAAGRVAAEAAYEAAEQRYKVGFSQVMAADYIREQTDSAASSVRRDLSAAQRLRWTQLANEERGQAARLLSEQAAGVRNAQLTDVRRRCAEGWRDAMTALAAALAAVTGLVGVSSRPHAVRWGMAALAAAVVTWSVWTGMADLLAGAR